MVEAMMLTIIHHAKETSMLKRTMNQYSEREARPENVAYFLKKRATALGKGMPYHGSPNAGSAFGGI